ncbi:hypothetical protein [Nitrosovibrio sp. Nv4]|nr:hypothetical protein [Nitrosovibrio sp. Nv4]
MSIGLLPLPEENLAARHLSAHDGDVAYREHAADADVSGLYPLLTL